MRPTPGTNWQNKPYFRRAMAAPGAIQVTRPYLSVTGPKLCVTLSLACEVEGAHVRDLRRPRLRRPGRGRPRQAGDLNMGYAYASLQEQRVGP